jgi:DNA-binding PadR family transcriptional regulator
MGHVITAKTLRTKIAKNFLEIIILRRLDGEDAHGYRIIQDVQNTYGVRFGPSTIYPLLNTLETNGYLESAWETAGDRPRKVYHLTTDGKRLLDASTNSLAVIVKQIA